MVLKMVSAVMLVKVSVMLVIGEEERDKGLNRG